MSKTWRKVRMPYKPGFMWINRVTKEVAHAFVFAEGRAGEIRWEKDFELLPEDEAIALDKEWNPWKYPNEEDETNT